MTLPVAVAALVPDKVAWSVTAVRAGTEIFGSDFPHVEGMSNPISYVEELAGLPEEDIKKIMGGNMINLLGIKVPAGV